MRGFTTAAACLLVAAGLAACGGGGGGGASPAGPQPAASQSPGGIWFGLDSSAQSVSLFIAETGDLKVTLPPDAASLGVVFGAGSASVRGGNAIEGTFRAKGLQPLPVGPQPKELGCMFAGTVRERQSLSIVVTCSDDAGLVYDEDLLLMYSTDYDVDSSLEDFANTYTLGFLPDTNFLSVSADGRIVGEYHNGAHCLVDGTAAIIDPDYALIEVTWSLAGCTDLLGHYEGIEVAGFAMKNRVGGLPPDSYYLFLTGQAANGFYTISVIYEPL